MKRIISFVLGALLCFGALAGCTSDTPNNPSNTDNPNNPEASGPVVIALKETSKLKLDKDTGYISRISLGMTKAELLAQLQVSDGVDVTKDGVSIAADDKIASGYILTAEDSKYTCAVSGDVNGDGKVDEADVDAIVKYTSGETAGIHIPAIDVNLDNKFDLLDSDLLTNHLADPSIPIGVFDIIYSEGRITADNEDSALSLSVTDNMQKIDQKDPAIGDSATIRMNLARNEIESAQIYLASNGGHNGLTVSFTQFIDGAGGEIETEMTMHHYVTSESALDPKVQVKYPDAMIPLAEFDIKDGRSQGFLIKLKPGKDAAPGLYESTVTVHDADGNEIKICKIYANVWDLTLPDESSCATAFGMSSYSIYLNHKLYEGDDGELYKAYYEYLLENRMSAYRTPYDPGDERFDEYLHDPRVSSIYIEGCQEGKTHTDEELTALYEKYKDDPDWQKKAYFYYVDEPHTEEQCKVAIDAAERLERLFPGSRNIIPIVNNPFFKENGKDIDQIDRLDEIVNLWCPISSFYTPPGRTSDHPVISYNIQYRYTPASVEKYGSAEDRFAAYKDRGDELWWYVCVTPQYPYANLFVNYQGELSRVLFWQQYMYDINGFLYYSTNLWDGTEWRTADNDFYSGDGLLLYCGYKYDIAGPIGSLRIEYVRDGIEDFEYLTMAEKLCGKDAVNKVLAKVTTSVLDYTDDSAVIEAAKAELAEMIMNASK